MLKNLTLTLCLLGYSLIVDATELPTRVLLADPQPVNVSLDEPATGCVMSGIVVHPVEQLAARVIWFNERICHARKFTVSYVSGILTPPDDKIHKGEKFHVEPAKVQLMSTKNL
ncbi:TPA: hypothetical protein ACHSMM_004515 [Yersinia enterocolitica]